MYYFKPNFILKLISSLRGKLESLISFSREKFPFNANCQEKNGLKQVFYLFFNNLEG